MEIHLIVNIILIVLLLTVAMFLLFKSENFTSPSPSPSPSTTSEQIPPVITLVDEIMNKSKFKEKQQEILNSITLTPAPTTR